MGIWRKTEMDVWLDIQGQPYMYMPILHYIAETQKQLNSETFLGGDRTQNKTSALIKIGFF